jgi:hypothetical protein
MKNSVSIMYLADRDEMCYEFLDSNDKRVFIIALPSHIIDIEMNLHILNWVRDNSLSITIG